jgi:hypothetical protein
MKGALSFQSNNNLSIFGQALEDAFLIYECNLEAVTQQDKKRCADLEAQYQIKYAQVLYYTQEDQMKMLKESQEIQEFCESGKTFEDFYECMVRTQAFAEKWKLAEPISLQSYIISEKQFKDLDEINYCLATAQSDEAIQVCDSMIEEYLKKYGERNILVVLQENGDFKEVVDVYECYTRAQTLDDLDKCNNAATDVIEESIEAVEQFDFNTIEN